MENFESMEFVNGVSTGACTASCTTECADEEPRSADCGDEERESPTKTASCTESDCANAKMDVLSNVLHKKFSAPSQNQNGVHAVKAAPSFLR